MWFSEDGDASVDEGRTQPETSSHLQVKARGRLVVHAEGDREARAKPLVGWWMWRIKGEGGCSRLLLSFSLIWTCWWQNKGEMMGFD